MSEWLPPRRGTRRSPSGSRSGSRSSSGSQHRGKATSTASSSRISSDDDIESRMSEIYDYLSETYSGRFFELGHEPPGMIRFIENLGLTQDEMDLLHQMVEDGWR